MRMADDAPQAHPMSEEHFRAARVGDVAEVNDVARLPAKPFAEPVRDLALRRSVVAVDEEVVIAGHTRRSNHDRESKKRCSHTVKARHKDRSRFAASPG
jgi:hypothetical protein